jgi:hypothetical protein
VVDGAGKTEPNMPRVGTPSTQGTCVAPENGEYLEQGQERRASDSSSSRAWSFEVDSEHSVKFATNEIPGEERRLQERKGANVDTLPAMNRRFQVYTEKYPSHLHDPLMATETAIKKFISCDEFKFEALEAI